LVSLERLGELGDISSGDVAKDLPPFPERQVDFGWVIQYKLPLLKKAAETFRLRASPARREDYEDFCRQNASWLDNYALFILIISEDLKLAGISPPARRLRSRAPG
jgi:4-alpha-glucanotransferase